MSEAKLAAATAVAEQAPVILSLLTCLVGVVLYFESIYLCPSALGDFWAFLKREERSQDWSKMSWNEWLTTRVGCAAAYFLIFLFSLLLLMLTCTVLFKR